MAFRALMVCGEDLLVQRLSEALERVGMAVETAADTGQAIMLLGNRDHDAIVIDFDLEGGSELVEIIRGDETKQRALLIALASGHDAAKSANKLGASFVLSKPINWEVARRTLRAAQSMIIRERRASIRERVRVSAKLLFDEQSLDVTIFDLSDGGLAVRTTTMLTVGTIVGIDLKLPGANEVVRCKGVVAWATKDMAGIEFSYVTANSAKVIVKWLDLHSPRRAQVGKGLVSTKRALNWGF